MWFLRRNDACEVQRCCTVMMEAVFFLGRCNNEACLNDYSTRCGALLLFFCFCFVCVCVSNNYSILRLLNIWCFFVCVRVSNDEQTKVNDMCHKAGVCYISCDARGVFAYAFCDFGDAFVVSDTDGNQVLTVGGGGIIMAVPAWSRAVYTSIPGTYWISIDVCVCVAGCHDDASALSCFVVYEGVG